MDVVGHRVTGDALDASLDTAAARILNTPREFPAFTVVDWPGEVATADWRFEGAPPRTVWAALAHHRDATSRSGIVVHAVTGDVDDALRDLATTRGRSPQVQAGEHVQVVVDGSAVSFAVATAPGTTVAFTTTAWGGLLVEAVDQGLDGLTLRRVDDLAPFLAGRRDRVLRRRSGT